MVSLMCWMAVFGVIYKKVLFCFISETLDSVVLDLGSLMNMFVLCFSLVRLKEQTTSTASWHPLFFLSFVFFWGFLLCNVNNSGMSVTHLEKEEPRPL